MYFIAAYVAFPWARRLNASKRCVNTEPGLSKPVCKPSSALNRHNGAVDKFKQLETFTSVAAKGSLTAAAQAEGVAAAIIGRRIDALEER